MYVGLRRDAAHVETRASHMLSFEDYYLQTILRGIFSGAVATRASTNDYNITANHNSLQAKPIF